MAGETSAIRGTFFDFVDDPWRFVGREQEAARFTFDGLMVVDRGTLLRCSCLTAAARLAR